MSKCAKVTLKEIWLNIMDLPFSLSILISSEKLLTSTRLDITEILRKDFIFTISLLSTTI